MKGKIGLVTAHTSTNYGALLQSYATQQTIEDLGFETEIIDYQATRFRRGIKFYWGLLPFFFNSLKESYKRKKQNKIKILDEIHIRNKEERKKVRQDFEHSMLKNIKKYYGYTALKKSSKYCKAVLIGSDQMWPPGTSFGSYLSLRFVQSGVRRISYATSLGVSRYPKYCYKSASDMWKKIDFLSVREEQGRDIILNICPDLSVKVVCDPTYLLSRKKWEEKIPCKIMSNEKYILCYFLGNSDKQKDMAARYANKKGLKCYTILSDESESPSDTTFADRIIIGASVNDFVNWIRGAECVITDSFHGLAFSVINEKQFFIFYRRRDDVKAHRNSRIDNILKMWQLENRFVPNEASDIQDIEPIDYNNVTQLVENKRVYSLEYLKNALTFND